MNSDEIVELFFSRAFEEMWNEKVLDDKFFVVPTNRILDYIQKVLSVPYAEYLYYLIDYNLPEVLPSHMTQFSCFSACEIEMCENLIAEDNPGFDFADIGLLFGQYCKSNKACALKKYGENQVKTSRQLGLTYEYCGLWYLDCIGYAYPNLNVGERKSLLARTILRDPLYGRIVRDLLSGNTNLSNYLAVLKESTILRRGSGITKILNIAIAEAERCGIVLGKYEYIKPERRTLSHRNSQDSFKKLFDKSVNKTMLSHGITIPKKIVPKIEDVFGIHLEINESQDIIIEFNNLEYQGRIKHFLNVTNGAHCYQIIWKGRPSIAAALKLFYYEDLSVTSLMNNTLAVFADNQSNRIILKPLAPDPVLDLNF